MIKKSRKLSRKIVSTVGVCPPVELELGWTLLSPGFGGEPGRVFTSLRLDLRIFYLIYKIIVKC